MFGQRVMIQLMGKHCFQFLLMTRMILFRYARVSFLDFPRRLTSDNLVVEFQEDHDSGDLFRLLFPRKLSSSWSICLHRTLLGRVWCDANRCFRIDILPQFGFWFWCVPSLGSTSNSVNLLTIIRYLQEVYF